MHSTILVALAGLLASASAQTPPIVPLEPGVTGQLGDAQVVTDNPVGVTYRATLPETNRSSIRGFIEGTAQANGTGVRFTLDFTGFPSLDRAPYSAYLPFSSLSLFPRGSDPILKQRTEFDSSLSHPRCSHP